MKKILAFIIPFLLLLGILLLLVSNKEETKEEKILTVATNYSYIYQEDTSFEFTIYDTNEKSILLYKDNTEYYLENSDSRIQITVLDIYVDGATIYDNLVYYIYKVRFKVDITEIHIEDCYFIAEYSSYTFKTYMGTFEIDSISDYEVLSATKLYGLSFNEPYLSLAGAIVEVSFNETEIINQILVGSNFSCNGSILNKEINKEMTSIYDLDDKFSYKEEKVMKNISVSAHNKTLMLIELGYRKDIYLGSYYIIIETNHNTYFIPTFSYMTNHDLESELSLLHYGTLKHI